MALSRTGLQAAVRLCNQFCTLLAKWQPSIVAAINASTLTSAEKTVAVDTITAIEAGCSAFRLLANRMEK